MTAEFSNTEQILDVLNDPTLTALQVQIRLHQLGISVTPRQVRKARQGKAAALAELQLQTEERSSDAV
jgi:hypothetical protein